MDCIGIDISKQKLVLFDGCKEWVFPNTAGLERFHTWLQKRFPCQLQYCHSCVSCQAKAEQLQLLQRRFDGSNKTSSFGIQQNPQRAGERNLSRFRHPARTGVIEHDDRTGCLQREHQHLCLTRTQISDQRCGRRTDWCTNRDPRQDREIGQIHAS